MKRLIGLLGLVAAVFSFLQCGSSKKETVFELTSSAPFTLGYATFKGWVAGVKGGGAGTNVVVHFNERTAGVEFQELYFRGQISEVKQPELHRITAYFNRRENSAITMDADPVKEAANTPLEVYPFKLESNEAVLSYRYNGKILFRKIGPLIEEKTIFYPEAPPSGRH